MSKNLESLLKGIDLTDADDIIKAFGVIDKTAKSIKKRLNNLKKENENIEEIHKKVDEAAYKLTDIKPLYNSKKMNSRAILYVLGTDNVVYAESWTLRKASIWYKIKAHH